MSNKKFRKGKKNDGVREKEIEELEKSLKTKKWEYDFTPGLMHYFNYRDPDIKQQRQQISLAVQNNVVFIIGGVFVAQKEQWKTLAKDMKESLDYLLSVNLVDDDQGLLLMSYFKNPDMYELHKMPLDAPIEDVRSILKKFNKYE